MPSYGFEGRPRPGQKAKPGVSTWPPFHCDLHTPQRSMARKVSHFNEPYSTFAHGRLYTALSRVCNSHDIRALFSGTNEERKTGNMVHISLLIQ
ncbi:hypothetical protein BDR04DRAFT_1106085 [Suillus decipiens]|nr:hypothetical protein BDR04DRAFT_1106085 [Suillus decipiens]